MKLANAFSLNMLAVPLPANVRVESVSPADLRSALEDGELLESIVGHADTAAVLGGVLGVHVPCNRATVSLFPGDSLVVGQYRGPRLPEGATTLPEGGAIEWLLVSVERAR